MISKTEIIDKLNNEIMRFRRERTLHSEASGIIQGLHIALSLARECKAYEMLTPPPATIAFKAIRYAYRLFKTGNRRAGIERLRKTLEMAKQAGTREKRLFHLRLGKTV